MFILGYPKDTIETCKATINYAKQINSIITQFTVFTPYPGTPSFKEYEKKKLLKIKNHHLLEKPS